ncbi:MAG: hypothetical protein K8T10_16350 [Candidatus Eremiobacteraeota bacterium]|nr:hypothetical protein [Candidatus Eremiobacteraeota bacterium]
MEKFERNIKGSHSEMAFTSEDDLKRRRNLAGRILESLLLKVVDGTRITHTDTEEGFELVVPLPGDRKQKVYITANRRDSDGEVIFQIFTTCSKAQLLMYEPALRMNMDLDYGALAIKEINGKDFLVIVDTQLAGTAQARELEKSIITIAEAGDELENILTGKDIL